MLEESRIENSHEKLTLKQAFERTLKSFTNIFAPLLVFTLLKDIIDNLNFIREYLIIAGVFLSAFTALFLVNLRLHRRKDSKPPISKRGKIVQKIGISASIVFILLFVLVFLLISFTDAHYVKIASEPNEKAAVKRIELINEILEQRGISGFRARAYASSGGNPWYMITINGPHFSRKSAQKTLKLAKDRLGDLIPNDAYIYTSSKISPLKRIRYLF